jgi:hypothetical protein
VRDVRERRRLQIGAHYTWSDAWKSSKNADHQ